MQRTLWPVVNRLLAEVPDADLLERYLHQQDQESFTQLVARYNRLVWGQCRNLLANDADADDAFQATFLILARSVKKIKAGSPLGPWLHGVAYRVCMNARRAIGRRAKREKASARSDAQQPVADSLWDQAFAAVAEEVQQLPENHRVVFVLCCLEGRSAADAAASLGHKLGTVTSRLSRAKHSLLDRLAKRGIGVGVVAMGGITASAAATAPAALVDRTLALLSPGTTIPKSVHVLMQGVTGMTMTPFKLLAACLILAIGIGLSGGGGSRGSVSAAPSAFGTAPVPPEKSLITPETQKVIDAGLEYLAKNQAEDGSWVAGDYRGNIAATALAGRAFLARGVIPDRGLHGARLTKAIEFILKCESEGMLAHGKSAPMYEHGFAVRFLAEAYDKVGDKALKERMKAALTKAVQVIANGQNRNGGWRYQPDSKDADISVTSCELHALAAAKAAGFEVPQATINKGILYLLTCQDSKRRDRFFYLAGIPSNDTGSFGHTAGAISALKAAGFKDDKELMDQGTEFIRTFELPRVSDAFLAEACQSAAPVLRATGGKDWDAWYSAVRDELFARRNKDGSWGNPKTTSHLDTAFALIALQSAK